MSIGRYMALKFAVGFGVFLVTCPLAFLLAGAFGSIMPEPSVGWAFAIVGVVYILGSAILTHLLTEHLAKRWSR